MTWDEYFMNIAIASSKRSKDPKRQVGAVVVDTENHIAGVGYNGFPKGIDESKLSWDSPDKLPYVIHAEANAIIHSTGNLKDGTIYVTLSPCNECAKLIIASGIKKVVYLDYKENKHTTKLFDLAGIKMVSYEKK